MADFEEPIFVGQTNLTIELDTKQTVTEATPIEIRYLKPNNKTGHWDATIKGGSTTVIKCIPSFDIAGIWKVWAAVNFVDLTFGPGRVRTIKVMNEGQVN